MIICDTMIWYKIARQEITPIEDNIRIYSVNILNIREVLSSHNIVRDNELAQNIFKCMVDLSASKIFDDPFTFVAKNANPNYHFNSYSKFKPILHNSAGIARGVPINNTKAEKLIKNELEADKAFANYINTSFKKFEKPKNNTKKEIWNTSFKLPLKSIVEKWIFNLTNQKMENYDWNDSELFLATFEYYLKLILVSGKKFEPNDLIDLLIMLYVKKNDRYYTEEKKWKKIISDEIGLTHYLYNP